MKHRKLYFEQLERRELLTSDWPFSVGLHKDLFVDGGAHLSQIRIVAADYAGLTHEDLFTYSHSRTRLTIGGNPNDLNGNLLFPDGRIRFGLVFVEGGKSGSHGSALGATGRLAFREFFKAGGSYTGSCAGAFLVREGSNLLGIWPGYMGCCNTGTQTAQFTESDGEFTEYVQKYAGTTTISGIRHIGGPIFRTRYRHPEGTEFVGIIKSGINRGTPYLIVYEPTIEGGRMVVQPSHPETARSGPKLGLMAAILMYAKDGANTTPPIKEVLSVDQAVEMTDINEKVGDGQYHRFQINVPAGLARLTINTNTPSNTELFVKYNDIAYNGFADFSGDSVVIDSPLPGLWDISVYGDHEILNGVPYILTTIGEQLSTTLITDIAQIANVPLFIAESEPLFIPKLELPLIMKNQFPVAIQEESKQMLVTGPKPLPASDVDEIYKKSSKEWLDISYLSQDLVELLSSPL